MPHFQQAMRGRDYLTALEQGTLTSLLLAGCFVGSLLAGKSHISIPNHKHVYLTFLSQVNRLKSLAENVPS